MANPDFTDNYSWCYYARFIQSSLYCHFYRHSLDSSLQWRHNDHDGVSNHKHHGCLLHRLFRRRSKKTSKLRVTGLCEGNSPGPVNSPHKGPVMRKIFPFDDVIMFLFHVSIYTVHGFQASSFNASDFVSDKTSYYKISGSLEPSL